MRRLTFLLTLLAAVLLPTLAFAQDGAGEAAGTPILLWILAGLGVAAAVLNAATRLWPGKGTYIGIGLTVVASVTVALQDLAASNPNASLVVIATTALSAVIGRARTQARRAEAR